jgi:cytochrome c oxidase cbb3-type subunit III
MTAFWHWFVVVLTAISIIGCLWLLFANARGTPGESTGHVWDEDLREYNNPLPRWWLNLFIITIVFSVGYLIVYPGLGNFAGTFGWTQNQQLGERMEQVQAKRRAVYATLGDRSLDLLARDPAVRALGREVFLNNCAGCHGADARGALGFPNLADDDWLYGGQPDVIVASIESGRQGQMPFFNGALDAQAADDLVELLRRWSDPKFDTARRERAMKQFNITCVACHGADGRGNPMLGAPNLTDAVWLYGGSREQIRHSILFGRKGNMPAHRELLSADDIRLVAAYVYGLSAAAP